MPAVFALAAGTLTILLALGVSVRFGQLAGIAAAGLAGCYIACLFVLPQAAPRGLIPVYAVLLGGLAYAGCKPASDSARKNIPVVESRMREHAAQAAVKRDPLESKRTLLTIVSFEKWLPPVGCPFGRSDGSHRPVVSSGNVTENCGMRCVAGRYNPAVPLS